MIELLTNGGIIMLDIKRVRDNFEEVKEMLLNAMRI